MATIDGVYSFDGATGAPAFHFIDPPTKQELTELVRQLSRRVTKMLEGRGLIRDGPVQAAADENEQAALDACRGVSLRRARFERIDDKGQSQQQLFADQPAGSNRKASSPTAADFAGFSLEAGVAMSALNKAGRERLIRYCLRGPLALERLSRLRDGSIAYRTKYGRGQRTHLVMTPVEFLARMASLVHCARAPSSPCSWTYMDSGQLRKPPSTSVPPPRIPLVRYFGVLAPNSPYRGRVVPKAPTHDETHEPSGRLSVQSPEPRLGRGFQKANKDPNQSLALCSTVPDDNDVDDDACGGRTSRYIDWATLMRRTFGIDPLRCPKCETRMNRSGRRLAKLAGVHVGPRARARESPRGVKVLAVISQPEVVDKILDHVGLPVEPDVLADGCTLAFDVTDEPIPDWAVGTNPESELIGYERGPPGAFEGVDPPRPDDTAR